MYNPMLSTTQDTTAKIWTQNNLKAVYQTGARHTDSSQHSNQPASSLYHIIMCTKETRPNNNRNILTTFTRLRYTPSKTRVMVFPTTVTTIKSCNKIRFQYTVPEALALAYKTKQHH